MDKNEVETFGACSMCGELVNEEEAPMGLCEDCDSVGSMEEKMQTQADELQMELKENI